MPSLYTALLALLPLSTLAHPTPEPELAKRAQQCGQYQTQTLGSYTLATNGWGWSYGTGSQCAETLSLSGNTIAWDTTWTWSGGNTNVQAKVGRNESDRLTRHGRKSYTNVQRGFTQKQLSAYTSMPTAWNWTYTGTNLRANAAYDTFVGSSANGANLFEVMVWLGLYGGTSVSPLSANGYPFTPIATPTIGGTAFDLAYGLNGNVKVYSFVAHSRAATTYSGDFLAFYKYLATNYASNGFSLSLYLQNFQAGTEVFTGSSAKLTTTGYNVAIN
ncbi:hypothetical protein LTR95_003352 [Oleoguttula sp. CCFEE 5521]